MILSTGEALVDMIAVDVGGRRLFEPVIGGSPLNVALGIARLGRRAGHLTKLSTDMFGEAIAAFMDREGIDRRFVRRSPRPTTMVYVAIDDRGTPSYAFHLEGTADRSMEIEDLPTQLPGEVEALHFGSISLVLDPTASTLRGLMRREAGRRFISLDPNIRPSVMTDRAAHVARFGELLDHADLIKASTEDVAWLHPGEDPEAVAVRWSSSGPSLAVVTDGERGLVAAIGGRAIRLPAAPVAVVDTVGAGDTFQAALLVRLAEEGLLERATLAATRIEDLVPALGFAAAAAALTCTRRGADLPRRDEVADFVERRGRTDGSAVRAPFHRGESG
ncbi:MAG: carbohydrate kinase [Siculibacillus sp.]|nr:carbohydrate kinase [Siculibacillus sp.]